jgi:hypothetical protein
VEPLGEFEGLLTTYIPLRAVLQSSGTELWSKITHIHDISVSYPYPVTALYFIAVARMISLDKILLEYPLLYGIIWLLPLLFSCIMISKSHRRTTVILLLTFWLPTNQVLLKSFSLHAVNTFYTLFALVCIKRYLEDKAFGYIWLSSLSLMFSVGTKHLGIVLWLCVIYSIIVYCLKNKVKLWYLLGLNTFFPMLGLYMYPWKQFYGYLLNCMRNQPCFGSPFELLIVICLIGFIFGLATLFLGMGNPGMCKWLSCDCWLYLLVMWGLLIYPLVWEKLGWISIVFLLFVVFALRNGVFIGGMGFFRIATKVNLAVGLLLYSVGIAKIPNVLYFSVLLLTLLFGLKNYYRPVCKIYIAAFFVIANFTKFADSGWERDFQLVHCRTFEYCQLNWSKCYSRQKLNGFESILKMFRFGDQPVTLLSNLSLWPNGYLFYYGKWVDKSIPEFKPYLEWDQIVDYYEDRKTSLFLRWLSRGEIPILLRGPQIHESNLDIQQVESCLDELKWFLAEHLGADIKYELELPVDRRMITLMIEKEYFAFLKRGNYLDRYYRRYVFKAGEEQFFVYVSKKVRTAV